MANFGVDPVLVQNAGEFYLFLTIFSVICVALISFGAWVLFGDKE